MSITSRVKGFYSKHTYPNYPLLAKPLWQYGYLGSSLFSGFLFESVFNTNPSIFSYNTHESFYSKSNQKNILIIGCGEILPYISRKFEPSNHKIYCVDLSASSLKRASIRLKLSLNRKPIYFIEDDINHFLDNTDILFDHVDCFGVLHHLDSPSKTLEKIRSHLAYHATCRVMVYNYPARWWIHYIASIFKLCNYSFNSHKDIKLARTWLSNLKEMFPDSILSYYLDSTGRFLLENDARFSDTFLHPREIRLTIDRWIDLFKQAGFTPFGLYDRYDELTELFPSIYPLYQILDSSYLNQLSRYGYFLGNLEIYLSSSSSSLSSTDKSKTKLSSIKDYPLKQRLFIFFKEYLSHLLRSSPFKEVASLSYRLWFNWIKFILFRVNISSSIFSNSSNEDKTAVFNRGYLFPTMFEGGGESDFNKTIFRKIPVSKLNETIKNLFPTSYSYEISRSSSTLLNQSLEEKLLPKTSFSLSDKKKQQILQRLSSLLRKYNKD